MKNTQIILNYINQLSPYLCCTCKEINTKEKRITSWRDPCVQMCQPGFCYTTTTTIKNNNNNNGNK